AWFRDMLHVRIMLEGAAALSGAPRRDPAIVSRLEEAFAEMGSSGLGHHYRKYGRFNTADAKFHRTIIASAGNAVFVQVYNDLQPHVHYARLYLNRGVEEESDVAAEHAAIVTAYRDGDGEAAREAVVAHLTAGSARPLKSAAAARGRLGH